MRRAAAAGPGRGPLAAALLMIAGCAVPPKSEPPPLRAQVPIDEPASAGATALWPAPQWWRGYRDSDLSMLIDQALQSSPSLEAAQARFAAAQAQVRTAAALIGVRVSADADLSRQRLSDNGLFSPQILSFHWYDQGDLGLSFNYNFDWWGKQRAQINAALDAARANAADRTEAALLLTTATAEAYFGWQSDQARLALARARIENVQRQHEVAAARLAADIARIDELHSVKSSLAAAQEQRMALETSAQLRRVELAALLSIKPEQLPPLQAQALPALQAQLPQDVGLDLIARRADIEASRERVEAAMRGVDAARAAYMPDISLHALVGVSSVYLSKLVDSGSAVPQFGAAIHLPIFDAGQLRGQYDERRAQLQSAIAAYNDAVISAAREVSTQALTRESLAARRLRRVEQVDLALDMRNIAAARATAGITDERPMLVATAQWIETQDALVQLDAAALQSDLALIRALGGGYQRAARDAEAPGDSGSHP